MSIFKNYPFRNFQGCLEFIPLFILSSLLTNPTVLVNSLINLYTIFLEKMKIIVTHKSPDMDGITSIWLIRKFFPGWQDAQVRFVMAGEKLEGRYDKKGDYIERINSNEVVHVDTGFGKFDHHQLEDCNVSAASLVFDYILASGNILQNEIKQEALKRIVSVVVQDDHFQEVYYKDTLALYHDVSLFRIMDGLKLEFPGNDDKYVEIGILCLNALFHTFENRVWAEHEMKDKAVEFKTQWGQGMAVETVNDMVLDIAQKKGYEVVMRKDPNNGFVRIKAKPCSSYEFEKKKNKKEKNVDLTNIYEQLKKMDPQATWFLHVSKKLLLNGSSKNPKMKGTKLTLPKIIEVFESFMKK
ncbi:MAG: hypothetical protein A2857_01465 [Candidatus Levybacteria bacterium RIFCSPHIGHO2_01_FULL_36_15]|nr:MAG: hypothetical protein A2857_01465 [Candidatus Levybacteria bacterium RIFCSPHIGHO2_01_FULL_36_15]OGH38061.1 MAG: hypothetical protein A2905_05155 [Candidatus Levybacteria bacterium RIFCSPLOWO2_01_FULL_36_10]